MGMLERTARFALCLTFTLTVAFAAGQSQAELQTSASAIVPAPITPAEQLHAAVRSGKLNEVVRLLSAGVAVDARDALGSTPDRKSVV